MRWGSITKQQSNKHGDVILNSGKHRAQLGFTSDMTGGEGIHFHRSRVFFFDVFSLLMNR